MKTIQLQIGDKTCFTQLSGFLPSDERLLEKHVKEMFVSILYQELDYNARIFKLETAVVGLMKELQSGGSMTDPDRHDRRQSILKQAESVLNE